MFNWKVFVVEFIGTFALVFVGAGAGTYNVGVLGVALAHGLTLAVFVYAYGHISGTHINPAVTLGLAANGNIKWGDAAVYWLAQFSGASLAAFLMKTFVDLIDPNAFFSAATRGVLTTDEYRFHAMGLEALLTFFLMNAVLHAGVDGKAGPFGGWVVGTSLTIAILAGGPLTGGSLNPARSFGPALFTLARDFLDPTFYLIYFMGPFIGAVLAVMLSQALKYEQAPDDDARDVVAAVDDPQEAPAKKRVLRKQPTRMSSKK
jgi:MIP family channel proteins